MLRVIAPKILIYEFFLNSFPITENIGEYFCLNRLTEKSFLRIEKFTSSIVFQGYSNENVLHPVTSFIFV